MTARRFCRRMVTGFALTVVLGSAPVHQGVSASISIAWGK
jgi:hypothetical protein